MDYQVISRLGRGGMGVVDLAQDAHGNQVALKRLTLQGSAHEIARAHQRFAREANVLSRLHHPNIVGLIEVIEEGDEMVLVMPYLSGGSLADRVAQHGVAPPSDVERLGERLLAALAEAHAAGIIHRDIKPANVLYDAHGEPQLADFGLAHTWDQTHGLTVAGMVVGTPGYMPPEQARDEPLTPATDIFALGATLLYAATGNGPYGTGDPALLMLRAANGEVQPLPKQLPKAMQGWLSSMLDPEPAYRPTAVSLLTGRNLPPRRPSGWVRTRNVLLSTVLVIAAGGLVAFGVSGLTTDDSDDDSGLDTMGGHNATPDQTSPDNTVAEPDSESSEANTPGPGPTPDTGPLDDTSDPPPEGITEDLDGELRDSERVRADLGRIGETHTYALPPSSATGDCEVEVTLTIAGQLREANITILDPAGRPINTAQAHPAEPGVVTLGRDLCPTNQPLYAEVTGESGIETEGSEAGLRFVLSREDG